MSEEDKSSNFWIYAISIPVLYFFSIFPVFLIIMKFKLTSKVLETFLEYFYAPLKFLFDNCNFFRDYMEMIFEFIEKTFG